MTAEVKSMTGYGNGEARREAFTVRAGIRSLNGKYFDLDLRMSRQFSAIEPQIRSRTQDRLQRGSIVFTISVEKTPGAANAGIQVDTALAASYKQALQQLASDLNLDAGSLFQTILQMPDVLSDGAQNQDPELLAAAMEAVDTALDDIDRFRKTEGEKLKEVLAASARVIRDGLELVEAEESSRRENLRKRLEESLSNHIPEGRIDRNRLEQELLLYIEKLDIAEEKQRLRQHLDYFAECLENQPGGRKLNFIAQEMGREINTLGVKSNHFPMQQAVVRMKEQLEQIKEQVLNLL
jgi:uncharacterized protein (TIGR00255 family)